MFPRNAIHCGKTDQKKSACYVNSVAAKTDLLKTIKPSLKSEKHLQKDVNACRFI